MRYLVLAAMFLSALSGAASVYGSPFLRINQRSIDGEIHFRATNVSQHPIVAYVVIGERGHHRAVWHGVYTNGEGLGVNKKVELGNLPKGSGAETTRIRVDYVRLANGEVWGRASTEEAKEIAARFHQPAGTR